MAVVADFMAEAGFTEAVADSTAVVSAAEDIVAITLAHSAVGEPIAAAASAV
jgi:hypothetical protein